MQVFPGSATLTAIGATVGLRALFRDVDGTEIPGKSVRWSSLNRNVATVDSATGAVTALQNGQVTIAASANSVTGYALITVAPAGARPIGSLSLLRSSIGDQINALWGADSTDLFAVGTNGSLLRFDGIGWNPIASNTQQNLFGLWGAADSVVFAVGDQGRILRYDFVFNTWSEDSAAAPLFGVWGTSPRDVFAVGAGGTIVHFDGSAWSAVPSPTTLRLCAVWGTSSTNVYAVGEGGVILHFDGKEWRRQDNSSGAILLGVWGTSPADIYAVGAGGTVLHTSDGTRWTPEEVGTGEALYAVWGTSSSDVLVVGSRGTVLQFDGDRWTAPDTVGATLHAAWGSVSGDLFLAGEEGTVWEAVRGGAVRLLFAGAPASVAAGAPLGVEVWVADSKGRRVPNAVDSISLDIRAGPDSGALLGTTAMRASDGRANFTDLHIGYAAAGYTLSATAPDLAPAESPSFTVTAGAVRRYRFLAAPAAAVAGVPITPVEIVVEDSFGNRVRNATQAVGVGVLPLGTALNGTSIQTPVSGVATFSDLTIEKAASGFRLTAGSGAVAGDTSPPFAVGPTLAAQITLTPDGSTLATPGGSQSFAVTRVRDRYQNVITGRPVTWTSLNPAVATVDPASGVASAVGNGQATLAAQIDTARGYALVTVAIPGQTAVTVWDSLASGTSRRLNAVSGTSESNVWAVGDSGTILHFDGTSWTPVASGTAEPLNGVWAASPVEAFAVGASPVDTGVILRYRGGRWAWMVTHAAQFAPPHAFHAVWGSSPADVYAVGTPGGGSVTEQPDIMNYDGFNWHAGGPPSFGPDLFGVWGASASVVHAVGARTLRGSQFSWEVTNVGADLLGVWGTSPNDVFAVGGKGIIHFDGTGWSSQLSGVPRLNAVAGTSSSDVYAVGDAGVMFRYDSSVWTPQPSPTAQQLNGIWIAPTGEVFVVGNGGLILRGRR